MSLLVSGESCLSLVHGTWHELEESSVVCQVFALLVVMNSLSAKDTLVGHVPFGFLNVLVDICSRFVALFE